VYRIDPEQEPEKFCAQGLVADRGFYAETNIRGHKCCCLIGRMVAEKIGFEALEAANQEYDDILGFAEQLDLTDAYAVGLMDGWEDGQVWTKRLPRDSALRRSDEYRHGMLDGAAAWSACVAAEACASGWLPDCD
jgi:hypothetical protein